MGADYIIGIDLSVQKVKKVKKGKKNEKRIGVVNPAGKGYRYSDVILHPDLKGYSSYDFNKGMEMYDIGYKCAIEKIPQIKKDLERLKK
jgi:hypothetical protein